MKIFSYLFIAIIVIFGLTFAVLNAQEVTLNYYVGVITLPLSLILVVALALGGLLGMLIGLRMVLRAKRENSRLQQRIKQHEKQCHTPPSHVPVSGDH